MDQVIIIKYGELNTKKDNKNFFINRLKENISKALEGLEYGIHYDFGRMFIRCEDNNEALARLKNIFGIHEIVIGYVSPYTDIQDIKELIVDLVKIRRFNTFKVNTKRSNKEYSLNSMEVSRLIGATLLKSIPDISVDVHNPDLNIYIEIRKTEVIYYFDSMKGLGGYPVGTLGKGLLMLSGGIDSPVAGYLTIKRGVMLEAIYFESPPHTSKEAKEKVIKLCRELAKYNTTIKLHVINFTEIQEAILKNIEHSYLITIMRRMMYRISAIVANQSKCNILVNGESIGQVASQTLLSMKAINEVVRMPVIRPVACFDKLEIIDIAKRIGTYEISTLPYEDCCTVFVPKHPVINPSIANCYKYEELIDYEELIYKAVKSRETIIINQHEDNEYKDIL